MSVKLIRSRTDRMVGGVCGGLAQYLGLDPNVVRLVFVLLALADGIGVLIYLIMWILLPAEGQPAATSFDEAVRDGTEEVAQRARELGRDVSEAVRRPHPQAGMFIGIALVGVGAILLLRTLGFPWLRWLDWDVLWPVLLIGAGAALLLRRR